LQNSIVRGILEYQPLPMPFNYLLSSGFSIQLLLQHYFELAFLLLALIYYRRLRYYKLSILLPLFIGWFFIDVALENSSLRHNVRVLYLFECVLLFFGIYLLPALRKFNLIPVLAVLFVNIIISFWMDAYWVHGKYNVFIYNLKFPLYAPAFYVMFYSVLKPIGGYKKAFYIMVLSSELFFCFDYLQSNNILVNHFSAVIYYLQVIVFSCLVIFKIITKDDDAKSINLYNNPQFWFFGSVLFPCLIELIFDGLHSYLVQQHIDIYKSAFLKKGSAYGTLFFDLCIFYSFFLSGKQEPNRLQLISLFHNKASRHSKPSPSVPNMQE
jgi:hypothetical protein